MMFPKMVSLKQPGGWAEFAGMYKWRFFGFMNVFVLMVLSALIVKVKSRKISELVRSLHIHLSCQNPSNAFLNCSQFSSSFAIHILNMSSMNCLSIIRNSRKCARIFCNSCSV
jgi:hypothetical protein